PRPARFSGRRPFAATGAQGISVGPGNTKPRRHGAASFAASASCHSTVPLVGPLKPAMMRSAVDLPQPDGPSSDTNSPCRTLRSRRSSAVTPLAKVLPTRLSATTGAADAEGSAGTLQWSLHEARRQMLLLAPPRPTPSVDIRESAIFQGNWLDHRPLASDIIR